MGSFSSFSLYSGQVFYVADQSFSTLSLLTFSADNLLFSGFGHCKILSTIPIPYPLDANNISLSLIWQGIITPNITKCRLQAKLSSWRSCHLFRWLEWSEIEKLSWNWVFLNRIICCRGEYMYMFINKIIWEKYIFFELSKYKNYKELQSFNDFPLRLGILEKVRNPYLHILEICRNICVIFAHLENNNNKKLPTFDLVLQHTMLFCQAQVFLLCPLLPTGVLRESQFREKV